MLNYQRVLSINGPLSIAMSKKKANGKSSVNSSNSSIFIHEPIAMVNDQRASFPLEKMDSTMALIRFYLQTYLNSSDTNWIEVQ